LKYRVCVADVFSAAHSIRSHSGVGRYIHGHDFRVRVCARTEVLGVGNIAVDLKTLEEALRDVTGRLDHKYLNEELGVEDLSAEYLAEHILSEVRRRFRNVFLVEVCSNEGRYCVEVSE
jgi:6-pyruvoyltetrahydropterin/6-carboxytetrahydropterin synthase